VFVSDVPEDAEWTLLPSDSAMVEGLLEELQVLIQDAEGAGVPRAAAEKLRSKLASRTLTVAVVALAKAGKSTLLNALIGREFLPSAAQPATSCVVRVRHERGCRGRLCGEDGGTLCEGRQAIHAHIAECNRQRREDKSQQSTAVTLDLFADIQALQTLGGGVELLDTPGPNEAGAGLEMEVLAALKGTDVVLYVLDFTKIGTADEQHMFAMLADAIGPLMQSVHSGTQRIFFVLNKIDERSRNDGDLAEIRRTVAVRISSMLPKPVSASQVIPVAAELALLSKQVRDPERQHDVAFLEDFLRKAKGECFKDEVTPRQYSAVALSKAAQVEEQSMFADLHQAVLVEMFRKKTVLLSLPICEALSRELAAVRNTAVIERSTAQKTAEQVHAALVEMQQTQAQTNERLQVLQSRLSTITQEVNAEAQKYFSCFRQDLEYAIPQLFAPVPNRENPDYRRYVVPILHWFHGVDLSLEASSREQLERTVVQVNTIISRVVAAKWKLYSKEMVGAMREKRAQVQLDLLAEAQPVMQNVIQASSESLQVPLDDEVLCASATSFSEFEADSREAIEKMVQRKQEKVEKMKEGETRTRKRNLCLYNYTEAYTERVPYFVDQVVETVRFQLDASLLVNQWLAKIREETEVSQATVTRYVEEQIASEAASIHDQIRSRCQALIAAVQAQQESQQRGYSDAKASAAVANESIRQLEGLGERARHVGRRLEKAAAAGAAATPDTA